MTRRSRIWLVVALLFLAVNLAGGVVAAASREWLHAGVHAALTLLAAYLVWRLAPKRPPRRTPREAEAGGPALPREIGDRLTQLEQSVDGVAVEVERIGEGQRFMTRLFAEDGTPRAPGAPAPEPVAVTPREPTPPARRS